MRVLFTTMPGEGHLNSLVPLAQALTIAGHEVVFACAPSFRPRVEELGLRAFPIGLDWSIGGENWEDRWPELRDLSEEQFIPLVLARIFAGDVAEQSFPDLLAIAQAWSPDVIVHETWEMSGWLAAETLGLPHASVEVTLHAFLMEYIDLVAASLARILERAGQPDTDVAARLFAYLHLSFVPPSFEDPAVPLPATAHSLRPQLLDPLPGEEAPHWLTTLPNRPTIYSTGGTIRNRTTFFDAVIAGVRDLDANLIVTRGRILDPAQFGPQPANVHLAGYISQALLLPHCSVVVNHGGFSSVLGALTCGVPLVILPDGADRSVNASRAAALGVAIVLDADQRTPAAIRSAVLSVLEDPRYRQRARAVQAEIESLPGPEHGVRLLERLVADRRPQVCARDSFNVVA